jgi:ribosome maturation factor RimP
MPPSIEDAGKWAPAHFFVEEQVMGDVDRRLWDLLEPWLEAEGVELDDLELAGAGAGRLVRVTVDSPGGIDLDRIADLSRGLSRILEDTDLIGASYTLEVSSPGLERPLRRPSQFRKAVGREVIVKTRAEVAGSRSHRGILSSVGEGDVLVTVDGTDRPIPFDHVTEARTVFSWEKAPKPGKRGAK